jgi:hypothetical protein
MTADALANLLQARRTGRGRWQAKCPGHEDKSPSLSISEGRGGRVLAHCFAGCATAHVMKVLGLSMRDLYAGPPSSTAKARQLAREQARQFARQQAARRERGGLADRARKLTSVVEALADRLVCMSDEESGGAVIARLFHENVTRLREAEMALEGVHDHAH